MMTHQKKNNNNNYKKIKNLNSKSVTINWKMLLFCAIIFL